MYVIFLSLLVKFQDLMHREEGQDLVEYALVVAIIALGATAAMQSLANVISTSFANISTTFATAL
jgi:pilus assembly protein Flp/PilA